MKIRIGHVSNSSTSSFIVLGYIIPSDEITETGKKLAKVSPELKKIMDAFEEAQPEIRGCQHPQTDAKFCSECGSLMWKPNPEYENLNERINSELSYLNIPSLGISCRKDEYESDIVVGIELMYISDGRKEEEFDIQQCAKNMETIKNILGRSDHPKLIGTVSAG